MELLSSLLQRKSKTSFTTDVSHHSYLIRVIRCWSISETRQREATAAQIKVNVNVWRIQAASTSSQMSTETGAVSKGSGAGGTFEGFDLVMHVHVTYVVATHGEAFLADVAPVGCFIQVHSVPMAFQTGTGCESGVTHVTRKHFPTATRPASRSRHSRSVFKGRESVGLRGIESTADHVIGTLVVVASHSNLACKHRQDSQLYAHTFRLQYHSPLFFNFKLALS